MTDFSPALDGNVQVLESIEADFDAMTWTFRLGAGNRVSAGHFAVIPTERYMEMTGKLAHAEGLLRRYLNGPTAEELQESILKFFDPPL